MTTISPGSGIRIKTAPPGNGFLPSPGGRSPCMERTGLLHMGRITPSLGGAVLVSSPLQPGDTILISPTKV